MTQNSSPPPLLTTDSYLVAQYSNPPPLLTTDSYLVTQNSSPPPLLTTDSYLVTEYDDSESYRRITANDISKSYYFHVTTIIDKIHLFSSMIKEKIDLMLLSDFHAGLLNNQSWICLLHKINRFLMTHRLYNYILYQNNHE